MVGALKKTPARLKALREARDKGCYRYLGHQSGETRMRQFMMNNGLACRADEGHGIVFVRHDTLCLVLTDAGRALLTAWEDEPAP